MKKDELIIEIKQKIASHLIEEALTQLGKYIIQDSESHDKLTLMQSAYNGLMDESFMGFITHTERSAKLAQIADNILRFMRGLDSNDIGEQKEKKKKEPYLLIICPNETQKEEMVDFFSIHKFPKFDVVVSQIYLENDPYDLIIFDNRDLSKEIHDPLMQEFIDHTKKFMIHFGGYSDLVSQQRARMHSANSIFALHARVKEMLAFINYRI